ISFGTRLLLLWSAVAIMPLVALLAVALNFDERVGDYAELRRLSYLVAVVGSLSGGFIYLIVGRDISHWLRVHERATEKIAEENFNVRIDEQRPDEFGHLTDNFNDMAMALSRGRQLRDTFGQMVHPEVRDEIMQRFTGLGGEVKEVTVLFADI